MSTEKFLDSLHWRDVEDNCNVSIATISYEKFLKYFGEYGHYEVGKYHVYVEDQTTYSVGLTCYWRS